MENHISKYMQVNGRNLYVEAFGQSSAPAVIFLHHGLGSTYSWQAHTQIFANSGYYVIAYDRWGYGKSDCRSSLITSDFKEDLADLTALLERLSIDHLALIGHSDGGTLAMHFAAQYPKITDCLITIAAHIYVETSMIPGIMKIRQSFNENAWFHMGLKKLHGDKTESMFMNWYDSWVNIENLDWDMRPIIRNITCPTLVIQGEDDEHATIQHARDIAEAIPGAKLWLEPSARHALPQDNPDIFNSIVLNFLKEYYVQ